MKLIPNRYNTDGPWFKGNTHIHTTRSDGGKDYRTVAGMYAEHGYDFIVITDHRRHADIEDLPDLPLLAINGIEIGRRPPGSYDFHVIGIDYSGPFPEGLAFEDQIAHLKESGAIVVLAHPCWSGNPPEDAQEHGFDGVEVYNHICRYLNGKDTSTDYWEDMLVRNPGTLGFAADDAHLNGNEPWDGGWIMVAAPSCTRQDILTSIRAGNFYSTTGPRFESIQVEADRICVRTSPVNYVWLADETSWGRRKYGGAGNTVTKAEFRVKNEHSFLRVEIEDLQGRRAWTNAVLEGER